MSLNVSKGNMYEFVTHTYNTVKGQCLHNCSYCYVKRWGKLNPVRFDAKELKTDLGSGNFIFVGSSCDMFSTEINQFWIDETLQHLRKFSNKYLFQTKNPARLKQMTERYIFPSNTAICTTIETNRVYADIMGNTPTPFERACAMHELANEFSEVFVTIEPIMDFDLHQLLALIALCRPKQVNIGADSGHNNLPEPSKEKVLELINGLSLFTKVVQKKNLSRILK